MKPFSLLVFLLVLCSCEVDYQGFTTEGGEDQDFPRTIIIGMEQMTLSADGGTGSVSADRAEAWPDRGETVFTGLSFRQTDADGELLRSGNAGRALARDNGDAELDDDVRVVTSDGDVLTTGSLSWNEETRLLSVPDGEPLTVERSGGTRLTGEGMTADLFLREVRLSRVSGRLVPEDDG